MTPREHKEYAEKEQELRLEKLKQIAEDWIVPVDHDDSEGTVTFNDALADMKEWSLDQGDVPLIIKLIENPDYKTSKLFTGAVDLFTHDCIHILLGRGILVKDEAFVIGYTMGSSHKMKRWRRNLFMFCAKYLYPAEYKFGEEERFIFNLGVKAGSACPIDLTRVDFKEYIMDDIHYARYDLGIDLEDLKACYRLEKRLFPESKESQRLIYD